MIALIVILFVIYGFGLFFNFAAVVGLWRMPDLYCRLHSSSKNATLGSLLVVFGISLRYLNSGDLAATLKTLFIGLLLLVITPIGSHALARAAYTIGVPLWSGTVVDQYPPALGKGRWTSDESV
jgi:multicomponent Na+:H+ antiporter subunit G